MLQQLEFKINLYLINMKKYSYIFISIIIGAIIIGNAISCNKEVAPPIKEIVYVTVKDTISEKSNIARIVELEHKCYLLQDSLNMIKDSIGEDLFVANYKLGRIKYYTDIAAKGNNIKYLRGWIYRVLNEK